MPQYLQNLRPYQIVQLRRPLRLLTAVALTAKDRPAMTPRGAPCGVAGLALEMKGTNQGVKRGLRAIRRMATGTALAL